MTTRGGADQDDAGLERLLGAWLPRQRWFAHKGSTDVIVRIVASTPLSLDSGTHVDGDGSVDGEVDVEVARLLVVRVAGAGYQVPVTLRRQRDPALEAALLGTLPGPDGERFVYDAPWDPSFVPAWLRLFQSPDGALTIDPQPSSRVLSGEQSNTSVIVGAETANPLIVKLFRVLAPGENPDVVVQSALAAAGCLRVPRPAGWLAGSWPGEGGGTAHGHLGYACEFLPGSEDAFRVATRSVVAGQSFAGPAAELGAATAQVHAALASALPTTPATSPLLAELADGLLARVDWAVAHAPQLGALAPAARAAVDAVRHVARAPDLQQVHGDYHLGQVLHAPGRGWVLLDFEGEPLRPLAQRYAPDLAVRDVAGMLRSFDYAARQPNIDLPDGDPAVRRAQAWGLEAREAFLRGYAAQSRRNPLDDEVLLRALELDKALYEVVYEVRNRPTWLPIPMGAVHRLLAQAPAGNPSVGGNVRR